MQSAKQFIKIIILASIIGLAVSYVFAWTGPTATPPGGNTSAPINIGSISQSKSGALGIGGLLQTGAFQLTTGPGVGKVLTSDASGLASWQTSPSGSGITTINALTGPAITITAGSNVSVSNNSTTNTITISSTGGGSLPSGTSGQTLRHNGTNWVENSNIFNNGTNVGIGTVTPNMKLTVNGNIYTNKNVYGYYDANTIIGLGEYQTAKADWPGKNIYGIGGDSLSGGLGFMVPNGYTVGVYAPTGYANFEVSGALTYRAGSTTMRMSNVYPTYYEFIENNSSAWGVSKWASSKRFKENITDLEIDSSKIFDLDTVSFNWKPERGGHRDFGLIAEETAEVLPALVAYGEDGKPFSVRYELLSVLLLDELKKTNSEVKVLNEIIEQLKVRIEKLEQKI